MKQKILVTGANGQLGSSLKKIISSYLEFDFIFLSAERFPIDDAGKVQAFFEINRPQYCINCAAYTAVDKAEEEKEKAFRVNAMATGLLAAVCKKYFTTLIHISTDYVFDGTATTPYPEDAPTNPLNVYGASKLEGEKLAMNENPGTVIIRTSWLYSEFGKNFVRTMLKLLQEKNEINVVNDQLGSPTYAGDLAGVILTIIAENRVAPGIYHYTNEGVASWYDLALAIKELSGSACNINPVPSSAWPLPAKRPAYSVLDNTKIREILKLPLKGWKDSLAICLKHIRHSS